MTLLALAHVGICGGCSPSGSQQLLEPLSAKAERVRAPEPSAEEVDVERFMHSRSLPGEWEPVDRLLVSWNQDNRDLTGFFAGFLREAVLQTEVTLVTSADVSRRALSRSLKRAGVDVERLGYEVAPIDTMWIRDYGPLVLRTDEGRRLVVDMPYSLERPQDDRVPEVLAGRWRWPLSAIPLDFEGGHLQSDGAGRCVITDDVLARNSDTYRFEQIQALLRADLGCEDVVVVPALVDEPTGHLDMFAYITGPSRIIVGHYNPEADDQNAIILNEAASVLQNAGFHVTRIPMPDNQGRRVFRTYTNGLALNSVVFVPVYKRDRKHEREALDVFARSFPNRKLVPVPSDDIMALSGAVHCTTLTIAR
jgi:agmatine deiminase